MSKPMSMLFACLTVLFMTATAVAISYSGWLAALLGLLTIVVIGCGFVYKAKLGRRNGSA